MCSLFKFSTILMTKMWVLLCVLLCISKKLQYDILFQRLRSRTNWFNHYLKLFKLVHWEIVIIQTVAITLLAIAISLTPSVKVSWNNIFNTFRGYLKAEFTEISVCRASSEACIRSEVVPIPSSAVSVPAVWVPSFLCNFARCPCMQNQMTWRSPESTCLQMVGFNRHANVSPLRQASGESWSLISVCIREGPNEIFMDFSLTSLGFHEGFPLMPAPLLCGWMEGWREGWMEEGRDMAKEKMVHGMRDLSGDSQAHR